MYTVEISTTYYTYIYTYIYLLSTGYLALRMFLYIIKEINEGKKELIFN